PEHLQEHGAAKHCQDDRADRRSTDLERYAAAEAHYRHARQLQVLSAVANGMWRVGTNQLRQSRSPGCLVALGGSSMELCRGELRTSLMTDCLRRASLVGLVNYCQRRRGPNV